MTVTEFTIDRNKWCRSGHTDGQNASLLNSNNGKMCCLGFYSKACGLAEEQIQDRASPAAVSRHNVLPAEMGWLVSQALASASSRDAMDLIDINDRSAFEGVREDRIKDIFASHGVKVTFVDGPVA